MFREITVQFKTDSFAESSVWKGIIIQPSYRLWRSARFLISTIDLYRTAASLSPRRTKSFVLPVPPHTGWEARRAKSFVSALHDKDLFILFVSYINDLPNCLMHSEISMCADDTVIYYSGSHVNAIRENLQEDLKRVEQWLMNNRLMLHVNQSKPKGLLFGTRQLLQTSNYVLQIQGKDIERVINYLGVILDEQLRCKENIDCICNKVNKRLGLVAQIRSCLTLKAAKCVNNTLTEPILCYTDTVWGELSATSSKTLTACTKSRRPHRFEAWFF